MPLRFKTRNRNRQYFLNNESRRYLRQLFMRINTFHRYEPPSHIPRTQMSRQLDEVRQIRKSARDYRIEPVHEAKIFNTFGQYFDILQAQFDTRLLQKGRLLMIAFEQSHLPVGTCQRQRDSRQTGATADIGDMRTRNVRQNSQAIKKMPN